MLILCRYEIQHPLDVCDDGAPDDVAVQSSSLSGTIEIQAEGPRLLLSDLLAAWPFASARWHFRAELNPPGEPHVFFDLADGTSTPVPLLADGTASVRALPLDTIGGAAPALPQGEAWAWSQEEFSSFLASRANADAADALDSPANDFGDGSAAASARWPSSDALSKASERAAAGAAAAASAASAAAAGAVTAATDFMRTMFKR